MSKTSTDATRHTLHGATMGTRWSAAFFASPAYQTAPLQAALQAAVDMVDRQMSTWNAASDLMRLNAAPVGDWINLPDQLCSVLRLGLAVGQTSDGAFDIGMGDAVGAWGFGPASADPDAIRRAMAAPRMATHRVLAIDGTRVRKSIPLTLDLNGIAKGYGVDRLAETLADHGIRASLVSIDGELRASGPQPDGQPWTVAIEAPNPDRRTPRSILTLHDAAVATSGDYRHWIDVQDRRLSHTMDPTRGAPLIASPASVTVIAPSCALADAWATALMVMGAAAGMAQADEKGLDALFLLRDERGTITSCCTGRFRSIDPTPPAATVRP